MTFCKELIRLRIGHNFGSRNEYGLRDYMSTVSRYCLPMIILVCGSVAGFAHAEPSACEQVDQACGKAGYVRGLPDKYGKDLEKGCSHPLLAGQTVPGVSVDPDIIKKCLDSQTQPKNTSHRRHSR
jgi:hypothetical protein